MMDSIDFVVTWVDGEDPVWAQEKNKYERMDPSYKGEEENSDCRYRNDGFLRYWFRAVERNAPWVNAIHFVTCGHKPEWLNEEHPKLRLVSHSDYIPSSYLPTFNSRTIELNCHRIKDLSEHFVLFNDDEFLLRPVSPEYFFKKGNPVLDTDLKYPKASYSNYSRSVFNSYCLINSAFDMKEALWSNRHKWFSVSSLGIKRAGNNFLNYLVNKTLPFYQYGHVALPHVKSSIQEVWERWPEIMNATCMHKFRADDQVNQTILCAWNQAKGIFYPANKKKLGIRIWISPKKLDSIVDTIKNRKAPQICVNDTRFNTEPEQTFAKIREAFQSVFPERSQFEKW